MHRVRIELQEDKGQYIDRVEIELPACCDSDVAQQLPKVVLTRGDNVYTFHRLVGDLKGIGGIFKRRQVTCV